MIRVKNDYGTIVEVERPSECPGQVFWNWEVEREGKTGRLITVQTVPTQSGNPSGEYRWAVQWPHGYEGSIPDRDLRVVRCLDTWRLAGVE